jgi:hypothetical protein
MALLDRCSFNATSTGTVDFVVASAATGAQTPASAGAVDQKIYSYFAQSADLTQWEVGRGLYTVSTVTLARTTVLFSTNSNAKVSFTLAPTVTIDALVEDIVPAVYVPVYGGRLTLVTGTPVLISNQTAIGSVFYAIYEHDKISIYDGSDFVVRLFTEQSVTLDITNFLSTKIYDLFMFMNAGVPALGYGPAWTSNTARSAAISRLNGVWTNTASITLRINSTTTATVAANQATYVGSVYATANGQTGMAFTSSGAGGGAGALALWNSQNQVRTIAYTWDTNTAWTYSTATWRKADNNANNSIKYIDGLGVSYLSAVYQNDVKSATAAGGGIGVGFNWASGAPAITAGMFDANTSTSGSHLAAPSGFLPALGLNTVSALEVATGTTVTFSNNQSGIASTSYLMVDLMM